MPASIKQINNLTFSYNDTRVSRESYHRPTCPLASRKDLSSTLLETGTLVFQQNLTHIHKNISTTSLFYSNKKLWQCYTFLICLVWY